MTAFAAVAYVVSAALLLYADQQHLIDLSYRVDLFLVWAALGVVLAAVSTLRTHR